MTLEEIKEEMCDNYCKWPHMCYIDDWLWRHCEECPLNKLEESANEKNNGFTFNNPFGNSG